MKLKELKLLQERLASFVHVNSDKTLSVISNLVQKKFGLHNPRHYGICLFSQFIFTLSSQLNIPEQVIADHYNLTDSARRGHTPAQLIDHFSNTEIIYKNKSYKLKIGLEEYHSVNDVIKTVNAGQAVVVITGVDNTLYSKTSDIERQTEDPARSYMYGPLSPSEKEDSIALAAGRIEPGEINLKKYTSLEINQHGLYHALLVIGYDSANDLLIGRDNRDTYSYKGYFRVKGKEIQKKFKDFKFIGFYIDDVKITNIKK